MYTTDTKAPIDGLVMIEFVTKSLITDACEEGAGLPFALIEGSINQNSVLLVQAMHVG